MKKVIKAMMVAALSFAGFAAFAAGTVPIPAAETYPKVIKIERKADIRLDTVTIYDVQWTQLRASVIKVQTTNAANK